MDANHPASGPSGPAEPGVLTSGTTQSYWMDGRAPLLTTPLEKDLDTDVAIIGGGIAGLSCAYLLMEAGRHVTLVDDGALGSGETGRTTAHFTNALDDRYWHLERKHGESRTRLAAQSHTAAIAEACRIVQAESIHCGLQRLPGYLARHPSDRKDALTRELDAARRAGLDVELVDGVDGLPGDQLLMFPDQMQLHPLEYLAGLAKAIERGGGRIHTQTHARKFTDRGFEANGHRVRANRVVVATNSPVTSRVAIHTKQAAYRTYVIAAEAPAGVPKALWWDTGDHHAHSAFPPYHYVRTHNGPNGPVLLVGGEDHKVGANEKASHDPFTALERWTRDHFPVARVTHRWSGQVFEPGDHIGLIGRDPTSRGGFLATGDSGNGMTHGTLAGMLAVAVATGRSSPWTDLYDPGRKTLGSLATMAREGLDAAAKYVDYLRPGDVHSPSDLAPGQGAVVGTVHPRAVYRNADGTLSSCSAVCPHMGCLVRWNPIESSFDCPCHGSRFSAHGRVLCGPSNADLEPTPADQMPVSHPRPAHGAARHGGSRRRKDQAEEEAESTS